MAGATVGILGGSFNPVHYGHIEVARAVVRSGLAHEVWLSLSPRNPFKEQSGLMETSRRLVLLQQAVEGVDRVGWTDVELSLPVPSYMIDALDTLRERYPHKEFKLVIGSDNLPGFERWKDWEKIITNYGLIVYPRGEAEVVLPPALEPYARRVSVLNNVPLLPVSSTQIRNGELPSGGRYPLSGREDI